MTSPLTALGVSLPVLAAPMAGGPTTPALVVAVAEAGGLGFLAAGYKTPEAMDAEVTAVRAEGVPFGVNLFVPNPVPVDPEAFRRYAGALEPEARALGVPTQAWGSAIVEDDDAFAAKIDVLRAAPVPVVSFTFGVPRPAVVAALRGTGTFVLQTVTSAAEARVAADAGVDGLVVQASAAGGHSGTLTPAVVPAAVPLPDLVRQVRSAVPLPVLAAGGVATAEAVTEALGAGALAVAVGTVLLRSAEAGTSAPYRAALADPTRRGTVVTRAFTGRPARALRNTFTDRHDTTAPGGYPAVHHLTGPLRRAATAAGDPEWINLWAGTGHRHATDEPAARILARLGSGV
ncbi:nitronate monooxygenase [Streptacidiphilus jiangxiensis]|uniref:Propionate 3-nitronate monooxygenase n=1 Tax=Streptacidiphilus jiangxiensis TaxID=235985 RepID=A0A1H7HJH9_STRJI|nr:nitronate monooxygenase [Streptacidiphilus jiangxiensis]SEK49632.1 NAD(P)H-dependent flavin oxidoreductase YrpB, nitropropane dioxygenase family [Streptacidiphilus jiangxiensis]